jgi:hypothetical protein
MKEMRKGWGGADSVVKMNVPLSAKLTCMIARPGV